MVRLAVLLLAALWAGPGAGLGAQLQRQRLRVATADEDALEAARDFRPARHRARLYFVRAPKSPVAALGVEMRFEERMASLLAPGTFVYHDIEPGTHPILARTVWGLVQAITFTRDHGAEPSVERPEVELPGPCCPKAVMHELTRRYQRLTVYNWEAHRLLWEVPDFLAEDPRTEVLLASYQNRLVPSRFVEIEIGAEPAEVLFFRLRVRVDGELSVRPLRAKEGRRLVERYPMSAVNLGVVGTNAYEAPSGYPRHAAPDASRAIMANGFLVPLGPPARPGAGSP